MALQVMPRRPVSFAIDRTSLRCQLGVGRLHGFGFAHEAVTQLRGTAGARQTPGHPRVAVATSGGGPLAAALLLAKD